MLSLCVLFISVKSISSQFCEVELENPNCTSCLDVGCSWVTGGCLSSCNVIADVSCYEPINGETTAEACEREEMDFQDYVACSSAQDCTSCVTTILPSDTKQTCQWLAFEGEESFLSHCQVGCGMLGCGSTDINQCEGSEVGGNGNEEDDKEEDEELWWIDIILSAFIPFFQIFNFQRQ